MAPATEGVRALLSDVHGVLYVYPRAVPGSLEAARRLRDAGFPVLFLTNSTQFPKRQILAQLEEAGFELSRESVFTAAEAAGDVLRARGHRTVGWLCAADLIEDVPGFEAIDPRSRTVPERVDAVVVGDMRHEFSYEILNRAFRWLHEGADLVALARNRFYEAEGGLTLDCGPFVRLLEEAAGLDAVCTGKPSPEFFRAGLAHLGFPAGRTAMVGDDLDFDIHPAMDLGMTGIQVRTGKFRAERYAAAARPADCVVDDFAQAVDLLLTGQIGG